MQRENRRRDGEDIKGLYALADLLWRAGEVLSAFGKGGNREIAVRNMRECRVEADAVLLRYEEVLCRLFLPRFSRADLMGAAFAAHRVIDAAECFLSASRYMGPRECADAVEGAELLGMLAAGYRALPNARDPKCRPIPEGYRKKASSARSAAGNAGRVLMEEALRGYEALVLAVMNNI